MKRIAIVGGEQRNVVVSRHDASFIVEIDGRRIDADLIRANASIDTLRLGQGRQYAVVHHQHQQRHEIFFPNFRVDVELRDPLTFGKKGISEDLSGDEQTLRAVMPGRVVRIDVSEGEAVDKGKALLVIEAMKMENAIEAPRSGRVATIHVEPGATVESGAELITIE